MLRRFRIGIVTAALLALPLATTMAEDPTVDEIIANNIEAKGGRDKIDSVGSLKIAGRVSMGGGMEAPFTLEIKRPNMMRMEFTFQGMTGIQAYDGETGWFVMPFAGKTEPEKMSTDQLKEVKEQADIDGPLVDYADKGHTVELLGKEEIEGTEAYKLKLTRKSGDTDYIYLDAEYFLEIKQESKRMIQGTEREAEQTFGDYKEVDGLLLAHSIESKQKGAPQGQMITMDTVELNVELPDDRFAMPAPAPAPAAEE